MANHRKYTNLQVVLSAPARILVGTRTTKSGQVKNVYKKNPDSKPIGLIDHTFNPGTRPHRRVK